MNLAKSSRVLYFDAIDHILRCWFSIQSKVTASTGGVASSDAGGGSPVDVSQVYSVDVGATDDNGGIDIGTSGRGTRLKVAATPVGAEGNGTNPALGLQREVLSVEGSVDPGTAMAV
jgi:hypothetical protein